MATTLEELIEQVISLLPSFIILIAIILVIKFTTKIVKALHVSCEPNQWILIIRKGEMVRAGVGISCFKGPFDQVAKFPSKVNRVSFMSEQMSKERQGVRVSGTLVWVINREADGPMKAYKTLGSDLASQTPTQANDHLIELGNAILRNQIANSSIEEIMTNRQMLRQSIRKEMMEVISGWGVWLETVEITDVLISSNALFKNMQSAFREEQHRKAELKRMELNKEMDEVRLKNDAQLRRIKNQSANEITKYRQTKDLEWQKEHETIFLQEKEIEKQHKKAQQELDIQVKNINQFHDKEIADIYNEKLVMKNELEIVEEKSNREITKSTDLTKEQEKRHYLNLDSKTKTFKRKMEQEQFNLLQKNFADEQMIKLKKLDTITGIYKTMNVGDMKVIQMGGKSDVIGNVVSKITSIVHEPDAFEGK